MLGTRATRIVEVRADVEVYDVGSRTVRALRTPGSVPCIRSTCTPFRLVGEIVSAEVQAPDGGPEGDPSELDEQGGPWGVRMAFRAADGPGGAVRAHEVLFRTRGGGFVATLLADGCPPRPPVVQMAVTCNVPEGFASLGNFFFRGLPRPWRAKVWLRHSTFDPPPCPPPPGPRLGYMARRKLMTVALGGRRRGARCAVWLLQGEPLRLIAEQLRLL